MEHFWFFFPIKEEITKYGNFSPILPGGPRQITGVDAQLGRTNGHLLDVLGLQHGLWIYDCFWYFSAP